MKGYRLVALTVSTAIFMQFLDSTILNTAIPTIARDLAVPPIALNVAILSYQLSLAILIPIATLIADRIGARNTFVLSLVVFMGGSILCAMSNSLIELVAARTVQGIGGGMMMPISRMLAVRSAAKNELINAMNWLIIPGAIGPLLGPAVGGLIVTYSSWQWIFLINIPVAAIGIAMTLALIPNYRDTTERGRFDTAGMVLIALAISTAVLGFEKSSEAQSHGVAAGLLTACFLLCLFYVRHARSVAAPVIDLSLLAIPSFRRSMISGTMIRVIASAVAFLLPLWFQLAMGMSPVRSGTLTMMTSVGTLISRPVGGILLRRHHPRELAIYGAVVLTVSLVVTACLRPYLPLAVFYAVLLLQGVAITLPIFVITPLAYVQIGSERLSAATGFYATIQQLSLSLGVATVVWTINAMHWLAHTTPADNWTYIGSLIVLSLIAFATVLDTCKLDRESTGALRPR